MQRPDLAICFSILLLLNTSITSNALARTVDLTGTCPPPCEPRRFGLICSCGNEQCEDALKAYQNARARAEEDWQIVMGALNELQDGYKAMLMRGLKMVYDAAYYIAKKQLRAGVFSGAEAISDVQGLEQYLKTFRTKAKALEGLVEGSKGLADKEADEAIAGYSEAIYRMSKGLGELLIKDLKAQDDRDYSKYSRYFKQLAAAKKLGELAIPYLSENQTKREDIVRTARMLDDLINQAEESIHDARFKLEIYESCYKSENDGASSDVTWEPLINNADALQDMENMLIHMNQAFPDFTEGVSTMNRYIEEAFDEIRRLDKEYDESNEGIFSDMFSPYELDDYDTLPEYYFDSLLKVLIRSAHAQDAPDAEKAAVLKVIRRFIEAYEQAEKTTQVAAGLLSTARDISTQYEALKAQ